MRRFIRKLTRYTHLSIGIGLLIVIGIVTGCTNNPASSSTVENASIEGRVTGDQIGPQAEGVEKAKVVVMSLKDDGTYGAVPGAKTVTDGNGKFSLSAPLPPERPALIIAGTGASRWEAIVNGKLGAGADVVNSRIDFETTIEARVYIEIVKDGLANHIPFQEVQIIVTPEIAAKAMHDRSKIRDLADQAEHKAFTRTKVKADVADSSSAVEVEKKFLVSASDESALIDSIISQFSMDYAAVDSILKIKIEDDDDDGNDDEHHGHKKFKVEVESWGQDSTGMNNYKAEVELMFTTDSTARADLIAAILERTTLTVAQIDSVLEYEDHGEDHDDSLQLEVESNIQLTDSTIAMINHLAAALDTVTADNEWELEVEVEKENGIVTVSQEVKIDLNATLQSLWQTLVTTVRSEVTASPVEEIEVSIEFERE